MGCARDRGSDDVHRVSRTCARTRRDCALQELWRNVQRRHGIASVLPILHRPEVLGVLNLDQILIAGILSRSFPRIDPLGYCDRH